jgi:hypothetical protein
MGYFVTIVTDTAPSSCRNTFMARTKKSAAKHVEPEDESQESPEEEPVAMMEPTPEPTISKAEAVRVAISAGKESPGDIHDFVLTKFGHDIPNQMVSSYKAQEKARQAKKEAAKPTSAKRGPKPKSPLVDGYVASPEKPKAAGEPDVLLALESVKELVGQFGAEKLKRMVDLMG